MEVSKKLTELRKYKNVQITFKTADESATRGLYFLDSCIATKNFQNIQSQKQFISLIVKCFGLKPSPPTPPLKTFDLSFVNDHNLIFTL